ncbi:MAG: protoporphyrinogen/coproporphyrinogen oxidase [Candidatus Bathycorpusculaceae bacterium]
MKVAILGGGLTGLTIGYLLDELGVDFEVLEKESECGGLMRTLQREGFTFDYGGSHIIFSKNKEILDFMLKLLRSNKVQNRRNTKILYKGKYYVKYPFENGLADLPVKENFECLYYFIRNLVKREKGELKKPSNLKEWFYYTFGEGIAEKYLIPYNEKIWKYPTEKMSLEWVERVPNPPVEDIIKSSLGIQTEGYTHQLYFYYPKVGGIQALIKSLEEKIKDRIAINFEVKRIRRNGKQWLISNGAEERAYTKVVSTIPIQKLVEAVSASQEVKETAHQLKYNSLITVMLGIDRKKINDLSWLYIPEKDILTHRVSFPSNYSPNVAPKRKSSVLAEITCIIGDRIWRMRNEEIINRVINELHQLRIIDKSEVCFSELRKTEYAYVISDLYYSKNVKAIEEYFAKTGIDLVGRFAEFKYLNMDACIGNAMNYITKKSS